MLQQLVLPVHSKAERPVVLEVDLAPVQAVIRRSISTV
jgi:hypothetical protein